MTTPKQKQVEKKSANLIGDSFNSEPDAVYVYREKGGRADGTHVKKYTHKIEKEDLERDLPPGAYILIAKSEGDMVTKKVFVHGQNPIVSAGGSTVGSLRELLEMKLVADQFKEHQQVNPLEYIRAVGEILRPSGSGSTGDIDNFMTGVDFAKQNTEQAAPTVESILAQWGMQQMGGQQNEDLKNLAAGLQKTFSIFAHKLNNMDKKINELGKLVEQTTFDPDEDPDIEQSTGEMMNPMDVFSMILDLPTDQLDEIQVMNYLRIADRSTDGQIRNTLNKIGRPELEDFVRTALEQKNKGQMVHNVIAGINQFLGLTAPKKDQGENN